MTTSKPCTLDPLAWFRFSFLSFLFRFCLLWHFLLYRLLDSSHLWIHGWFNFSLCNRGRWIIWTVSWKAIVSMICRQEIFSHLKQNSQNISLQADSTWITIASAWVSQKSSVHLHPEAGEPQIHVKSPSCGTKWERQVINLPVLRIRSKGSRQKSGVENASWVPGRSSILKHQVGTPCYSSCVDRDRKFGLYSLSTYTSHRSFQKPKKSVHQGSRIHLKEDISLSPKQHWNKIIKFLFLPFIKEFKEACITPLYIHNIPEK